MSRKAKSIEERFADLARQATAAQLTNFGFIIRVVQSMRDEDAKMTAPEPAKKKTSERRYEKTAGVSPEES